MGHFNIERQYKAEQHTELMASEHEELIKSSIENSKVYRDNVDVKYYNVGTVPNITVESLTTEQAIHKYGNMVTALNFASYKYPGGGFIKGSIAQEEALCHASFLYNVIGADKFADEYVYNREHLHGALYENFGIYSPGILFVGDENNTLANIITVPAPNVGACANAAYFGAMSYDETLQSRIKFVLDIAEANKTKTLILGAFGCGVFKNNPVDVANHFKKLLMSGNYNFENVIFAVPKGKNNNYEVFSNIFK